MIGLIPVLIYYIHWQNLDRKTKPDGDTRFYTDRRIDDMRDQIHNRIKATNNYANKIDRANRANGNRLDWQEEAINKLLIKAGVVEVVGHIKLPDGASYDQMNDLIEPWEDQGYLLQGNGSTITIYELPLELKK